MERDRVELQEAVTNGGAEPGVCLGRGGGKTL